MTDVHESKKARESNYVKKKLEVNIDIYKILKKCEANESLIRIRRENTY